MLVVFLLRMFVVIVALTAALHGGIPGVIVAATLFTLLTERPEGM